MALESDMSSSKQSLGQYQRASVEQLSALDMLRDGDEFDELFNIIDNNQDGLIDQYEAFTAIVESASISRNHSKWLDLEIALRGVLESMQQTDKRVSWNRSQFRQFCVETLLSGDVGPLEISDKSQKEGKTQGDPIQRLRQKRAKQARKYKDKMISELDEAELSELLGSKLRFAMKDKNMTPETMMRRLLRREPLSPLLQESVTQKRIDFVKGYRNFDKGKSIVSHKGVARDREGDTEEAIVNRGSNQHELNFAHEHFTVDDLVYIFDVILNCAPPMAKLESLFRYCFQLDYQVSERYLS